MSIKDYSNEKEVDSFDCDKCIYSFGMDNECDVCIYYNKCLKEFRLVCDLK